MVQDSNPAQSKQGTIVRNETGGAWWQRLRDSLWDAIWQVYPATMLTVTISPSECYSVIEKMAKPSVSRLHDATLYARGRRYFLEPTGDGDFEMTTTCKVSWHPTRRTSPSAILDCEFERADDLTHLHLRGHFRLWYFVQLFFWPLFLASMIVLMPWSLWIQASSIGALFVLSYLAHYYDAALEAHNMVFFIEKSLEDYAPDPAQQLPADSPDLVYSTEQDFVAAWERFYDEMHDNGET